MIFFWKGWKFHVDFENEMKIWKDVFGFEDNFVWTCFGNFSQTWQEYMRSAVNVLKKCPKISDPTKQHVSQFNFFLILMEN